MNYWVFEEEQLRRALDAHASSPEAGVDPEMVRRFLYSGVVGELNMRLQAPGAKPEGSDD